jgi:hypothetical protein
MEPLQITSIPEQRYQDAHLDLDFEHKIARLDTKPLGLTRKEYDLLALLIQNAGEVVAAAARLGLHEPDPHPHARRAHPPAAQEDGRAQRRVHRDHLRGGLPLPTVPRTKGNAQADVGPGTGRVTGATDSYRTASAASDSSPSPPRKRRSL